MDWNSKEGRDLLWRAYPLGFLPLRGVSTLKGWQCTEVQLDRHDPLARWLPPEGFCRRDENHPTSSPVTLWFDGGDNCEGIAEQAQLGNLLPLPNPLDTATWSCLLADLAAACGSFEHRKPWTGLSWGHWPDEPAPPGCSYWVLTVHDVGGRALREFYLFSETHDAAEALVRARIQLRVSE